MKKRWSFLLLGLLAVVAAGAWYQLTPPSAPAGQPPLATLDSATLAELQSDFNRDADRVRVIVLLSPT